MEFSIMPTVEEQKKIKEFKKLTFKQWKKMMLIKGMKHFIRDHMTSEIKK